MSASPQYHIRISKFLSFVLRHKPQAAGLALDREGWAKVEDLLLGAGRNGIDLDRETLRAIVAASDKKRFTLSPDGTRIRAAQGHSTGHVDIAFEPIQPPDILYHGTARSNLESIMATGLEPRRRHYVHLSPDERTAIEVGRRHGEPVVLTVAAGTMHDKGFEFHQADNGVWLTRSVPAEFLTLL